MMNLSDRQQRILEFIRDYLAEHNYPPTIREIGAAAGISSTSVVNYNLDRLVEYGLLERDPKSSRSMRLLHEPMQVSVSGFGVRVPLYGQIAAGRPIQRPGIGEGQLAYESIELTRDIVREPDNVYALQVRGDSMIDALVSDGDLVVLRAQQVAENGEMVAAWLPEREETTLKYFYLEDHQVRLQPANPAYAPIIVPADQVEIHGKVIAIIRRLG